ncbi:MAG: hypothetical protein OXU96_08375 [Gammaproteobacteria bacterium]|nr:hypothetical protein [Gammaproteobacteria bacterium]
MKRALIMDGHVGCQLWQKAALEESGVEAKVLSLRRRTHPVAFPLTAAEEKTRNRMKFLWWRKWRSGDWSKTDGALLALACNSKDLADVFGQSDIFLGAYPPNVGTLLMDLARRYGKRIILNLANRFTWHGAGRRAEAFAALLREIHDSEEHTLAVMGEYDYRYVAHYLGVKPVKLYTSCHHMPLHRHKPACDTVLVGPTRPPHNPGIRTGPFASTEEINALYQRWCAKNRRPKAVKFGEIRRLYPHYGLEDLAKHPAVVLFPYSAYSISMAELYEMNMPFFVPSVELLLKHRMPQEVMAHRHFGAPHPDSRVPYSFHDSQRAMAHWLRFCYFYQVENAVVWDSPDDLFRKLAEYDLPGISEKMYLENKARREESLRRWAGVLNPIG